MLPQGYAPLLKHGSEILQRRALAAGLTSPKRLPAAIRQQCYSEAIEVYNTTLVYQGETTAPTFADTAANRQLLEDYLLDAGPVAAYLRQPTIEDCIIQGYSTFYAVYGRADDPDAPPPGAMLVPGAFWSDQQVIDQFRPLLAEVGAVWDLANPICDATLANGLRFHGVLDRLGRRPVIVIIRRHQPHLLTLADLLRQQTLSPAMQLFLEGAVRARLNIVIAGEPGAGKTTTLDALIAVPHDPDEQLVVIQAEPELAVCEPAYSDVVPRIICHLTSPATADSPRAITERDLARAALRERPSRVIIGELRGPEAYSWLQALNIGCNGSFTTVHGSSPLGALRKIHAYAIAAGEDLPSQQIVEMIAETVDLVIHQRLERRTGIRRIVEIAEVAGYAGGGTPTINVLFRWDPALYAYVWTGVWPRCADRFAELDLPLGLDPTAEQPTAH